MLIKRKVECLINKHDTVAIIDELSKYGNITVKRYKDNGMYQLTVTCEPNNIPKCLEAMFGITELGIAFRRPNIKWTL
jgi:hypothetical protein